ncbi:MAG TPA: Holliday junction resolvase RuvX, partial [Rudaea sp.]|nr:Holliday junction resolvase RuvX [Rudaea sp.]
MRDDVTSTPHATSPRPTLTVLGFDYGARRIGVAVGNTFTGDARALSVVG